MSTYDIEKIGRASLFDRIIINIDQEKQNEDVEIDKIGENENFIVFKYKKKEKYSYPYFLGQSKKKTNKVFYLGQGTDLACIYKDSLFTCNSWGELNAYSSCVHRINLKTKVERNYNLRGDHGKCIFAMGYGRIHTLDTYKKMEVEDDELVIDCHRTKGTDKYAIQGRLNKDMDYKVVFRYINENIKPYILMDGEEYSFIVKNEVSDRQILKDKKRNKILSKLDDLIAPFGLVMMVMIIVGIIAGIITKFTSIVWNIILGIGVVGLIVDDLLNRYIHK